jgi:hypothetical protein
MDLRGEAYMTPEVMLPDSMRREAVAPRRFNPRSATPFVNFCSNLKELSTTIPHCVDCQLNLVYFKSAGDEG